MILSKLKFALIGVAIMGVFSLNFTNPFAMSNNEFDVKGVANEMQISTTSVQSTQAAIPTTLFLLVGAWAIIHNSAKTAVTSIDTDINVFDGVAKINASRLAMNKLD